MPSNTSYVSGNKNCWFELVIKIVNLDRFVQVITKLLPFLKKHLFVFTAQKMKFSIKDFLSKCDEIRRKLRIWSHLLKKSLMENFIFCEKFSMMPRISLSKLIFNPFQFSAAFRIKTSHFFCSTNQMTIFYGKCNN